MDTDKKYVALTFDDGPTEGITNQVLDILEENGALASFFLIGQQITKETEYLVKRAYEMGCSIENHTKTHPNMTQMTDEEILGEIKYTTDKIIEVTGEAPQFFRPPYILYNQKMYDLIDLTFICGCGCEDWVLEVPTEDRIKRMLEAARNGVIYLLHDMDKNVNTVEALKVVIPELKKQGYEFVTIRDLFKLTGVTPQRNATYLCVDELRKDD